jgi:hypothetical protein
MFDTLRHALEQQHERIAEQLAAVVEAEAALERMRRAFGLEDAAQDAAGRAIAADAPERAYEPLRGSGTAMRTCAAPAVTCGSRPGASGGIAPTDAASGPRAAPTPPVRMPSGERGRRSCDSCMRPKVTGVRTEL